MSRENPLWGSERIRGELLKIGLIVSNRSIRATGGAESGQVTTSAGGPS